MDFKSLKKNRGAALKALQAELEDASGTKKTKKDYKDSRFWEPAVDKVGNGGAIIRFLPSKGNDVPFVKLWSHGFRGPSGMWYIENSRTTLGESDPVAEFNTKLWNSGNEQQARDQKRRLHFIANVLVVKDPANPENNGKVFLYKFGKKIFEKIEQSHFPPFDEEGIAKGVDGYNPTNSVDPFDMWEGANFRLLIRKLDGYRNYDMSKFDSPSAAGDDEELEKLYDSTYDVSEIVSESNFKSYDELKDRLNKVLALEESGDSFVKESKPKAEKQVTEPVADIEVGDDSGDEDIDLDKLMEELG